MCVSTRSGGVSEPPYAALNLGLSTGDRAAAVRENRDLLRRTLQLDAMSWHLLKQVHGRRVVATGQVGGPAPEADGLWTSEANRVLVVGVADCVPAFIWDSQRCAVALVHAGWRGTAAGIVCAAVEMLRAAGSQPNDLWLALGPSIGACCYEVGGEVCEALPDAVVHTSEGRTHVDLRRANRLQALGCGIPETQMATDPPCTACRTSLFFSHRKQGPKTGRQWALAWMTSRPD